MLAFFTNTQLKRSAVKRWLLPSLIARILIPIGFMPGNLWAGEYMVPCPSAMPESVFAVSDQGHHGVHSHHEHHQSDDGDLLGAERQCPIGLVLSAVFIAAPEPQPFAPFGASATYLQYSPTSPVVLTPRRYYSRAPPLAVS